MCKDVKSFRRQVVKLAENTKENSVKIVKLCEINYWENIIRVIVHQSFAAKSTSSSLQIYLLCVNTH